MSRWLYGLSALLVVIGIAVMVAQYVSHRAYVDSLIVRASVPGTVSLAIDEATTITLYNEVRSTVSGELWEAGKQAGLMARAWGPDGAEIEMVPAVTHPAYRLGLSRGVAVAQLDITQAGQYEIEGYYREDYEPEPAVFALSTAAIETEVGKGWLLTLFGLLLVLAGIFWAGIVCRQRVAKLVDYESRAVPTISSTRMYASLWRRIAGSLLDFVFLVIILMISSGVVAPLYRVFVDTSSIWTGTLIALAGFAAFLAYFVVLEAKFGWTLGKLVTGLRVVTTEGRLIGWERAIVRNLLRFVDMVPFCYLVGLFAVWTSEDNRRVGDRFSDTVVVER